MSVSLTLGQGLTIGNGITFGAGTGGDGGGGGGGGSLILSLLGSVYPSGTTLLDQSPNGNDFNWSGDNPAGDGENNVYTFANNTFAQDNSNTLFDAITNQMTIFAWVQFYNGFSGNMSIISRYPSFALRVDNGGNNLNLVKYNIADQDISYDFNTSDWYNICAIQSASGVTYVINGNTEGTVSGNSQNFNSGESPVFIAYDAYTEEYSTFNLARLDVWNTAKSVSDAQAAWNSQKSTYGY